jgi:enamine deaminase RidA (YjgF/YER057c/UK114 family)
LHSLSNQTLTTQAQTNIIEHADCTIVLSKIKGPEATEIFATCHPKIDSTTQQTKAIYNALADGLQKEGGSLGSIVSETIFLRSIATNLDAFREAREQAFSANQNLSYSPAVLEIEQPPIDEQSQLETSIQALIPHSGSIHAQTIHIDADEEGERIEGLKVEIGNETRFYASNICGHGKSAFEQTSAMFNRTEMLLQKAGMTFTDVARTWIHLREMDRDYDSLNKARREFFTQHNIDPVPASTGIEGGQTSSQHDLSIGIYAIKARSPQTREVMTCATLNEAEEYGADFVRGMKVAESNKVSLLVSGTASVDEAGATAHVNDFDAQAERMLVNLAALLDKQGASFSNIVSATTYVKERKNAKRLQDKFVDAGFTGFPNVLVEARVCRPDLLCETEVLAVLPTA